MANNAVRKVGVKLVRLSRAVTRIRAARPIEGLLRFGPSNVLTMSAHLNEPKAGSASASLGPCTLQQAIDRATRA